MQQKKVVVLGTGGTIAGVAQQAENHTGYRAAQLGVAQLLADVPGIPGRWNVLAQQVAQIDSKDMDWEVWRTLALRCAALLHDDTVDAIVITHGTDTLEETAWFLHCVLAARKPVVLTCAMRPATALCADGPQNLCDALTVAGTAGVQGVLTVVAGTIHSAQAVQKVHPYRMNAFSSGEAGPLGWVEDGMVRWGSNWPLALDQQAPKAIKKIADAVQQPWVEIVFSHAGAQGRGVDALVAGGVQGIVVAATGNASLHHALEQALARAQSAGVQVRLTTRCPLGQVLPSPSACFPTLPGLSAVKARVSLLLECL